MRKRAVTASLTVTCRLTLWIHWAYLIFSILLKNITLDTVSKSEKLVHKLLSLK